MRCLALALWHDECGFIISAELVLVATTVLLGLTVGLVAVRDAIGGELSDLAAAFRSLDQSYYKSGVRGCRKADGTYTSWTAGSAFFDPHLRTSGPQQEFFPDDIELEACSPPVRVVPSVIVPTAELPCVTCPPAPVITPFPVPQGAIEATPSTVVPCLSCPPGTRGLLAPTPMSALPNCAAPATSVAPAPGVVQPGTVTPFAPVCNPCVPIPTGPLQVW